MHLRVTFSTGLNFCQEGANMLIDIGYDAGTDVVLFTKLCDLIKGHVWVKRS